MLIERLATVWASYRSVLARELRVLVVDDEPVIRGVLQQLLAREGFVVDTAAVAESARQRIDEAAYDLLIVDKNLPGQSGLQLISELRDAGYEVPAVLITGYPSVESVTTALRAGAVDYIEKPFPNFRQLVQRLRGIVDQRLSEQVYARMARDLSQAARGSHDDRRTAAAIAHELARFKGQLRRRPDVLLHAPVAARAEVISDALQSQGLSVACADSVDDAAASLDPGAPPAVVVVAIDDETALTFIAEVRARSPLSAVIAVHHGADLRRVLRALEVGAEDVVDRQVDSVDVLVARVQRMARHARRQILYTHLFATLVREAQRVGQDLPESLIEGLTPAQRRYLEQVPAAPEPAAGGVSHDLDEVLEQHVERDAPRVSARLALRYGERGAAVQAPAATRDLSHSGLFVVTPAVLPPGTRLTMDLLDPDTYAERAVRVQGQVVRYQVMVPDPRARTGFGVCVEGNNLAYRRLVDRLLSEHENDPASASRAAS